MRLRNLIKIFIFCIYGMGYSQDPYLDPQIITTLKSAPTADILCILYSTHSNLKKHTDHFNTKNEKGEYGRCLAIPGQYDLGEIIAKVGLLIVPASKANALKGSQVILSKFFKILPSMNRWGPLPYLKQLLKDIQQKGDDFFNYVKNLINPRSYEVLQKHPDLRTDIDLLKNLEELFKTKNIVKSDLDRLSTFLDNLENDKARRRFLGTTGKGADDIISFILNPLSKKLEGIQDAWKAVYPQIFFERQWFEDMMRLFRYSKSNGWGHTSDIAHNFKAVDFYHGYTVNGNIIDAQKVVSMKTTTTINVDNWLANQSIKDNLNNLLSNIGPGKGIISLGKTLFYTQAELHIYMPASNISTQLRNEWLNKLGQQFPSINFEIQALEDFVN